MAKKGGVQQLQAEINTDEEFDKFIDRPGLIVCDVYSEWCGPCLGMVGSLKKIKLELGGDNLHLAICKSDSISYLERFNKKSEPTWLFILDKKAVNLMFGTNVPKLMKLITDELAVLGTKTSRPKYDITELQPEEVMRKKAREEAEAEAIRIEEAEKERAKRTYHYYVTDVIMDTLGDIGVSIFGPQVSRDMFKKINEPAELLKLQCKDRKYVPVTRENFELVNSLCTNGLSEEIIDQLDQRELLICFWKMPEDRRSVVDTMFTYVNYLTQPHTEPPSIPGGDEVKYPAVIFPMELRFEKRLTEDEAEIEEPLVDAEPVVSAEDVISALDEEEESEEETDATEAPPENIGEGLDVNIGLNTFIEDANDINEQNEEETEPSPTIRIRIKKVIMPPVWVPNTNRAHAALVYVFFRSQTTSFLPPDPVPDPPHIIMAFDAYKKKDLLDLYSRHRHEVAYYGFFTSDDVQEAKLIATDLEGYMTQAATPSDKIIFRVNKQTSHLMLAFANFGPSYVSANTVQGKEEALKLFPKNYGVKEEVKDEESGKKKKRKSKKDKEEKKEVVPGDESTPTVTSTEGITPDSLDPAEEELIEETDSEFKPADEAISVIAAEEKAPTVDQTTAVEEPAAVAASVENGEAVPPAAVASEGPKEAPATNSEILVNVVSLTPGETPQAGSKASKTSLKTADEATAAPRDAQ